MTALEQLQSLRPLSFRTLVSEQVPAQPAQVPLLKEGQPLDWCSLVSTTDIESNLTILT